MVLEQTFSCSLWSPCRGRCAFPSAVVACGEPMLDQAYPEGQHPLDRTHKGAEEKCEAERSCYGLTTAPICPEPLRVERKSWECSWAWEKVGGDTACGGRNLALFLTTKLFSLAIN